MMRTRETALAGTACAFALMLTACGGGSGGGPASPLPTPTPSPTPTPTPTPSALNDSEYQASNSAVAAAALSAYERGATGTGVKVAVIDTGINPTLPEFAGRIDPASQDVAANRGISDDQGHGSMVSGVLAANRDGQYMQGVAYNATILSLNVYDPAGCKPGNDCFLDDRIDEAIDLARTNGAKIINMSFGDEEGMTADVWPAIQRAVDAGILIVMAAGNGGTANPNGFALQNIQNNGGSGLFIIAGSMDSNRNISSFSDRAGTTAAAQYYLTALGRGNATVNHLGQRVAVNGTSFATPTIAGAAALLASAFPNLTGSQIVQILLTSADDAGAAGTDATFGRGILNIGRAFLPSGATSLAGSAIAMSVADNGAMSAPMGDAGAGSSTGAVILDGYSRAYVLDVAKTLRQAPREQMLRQGLSGVGYRIEGASAGPVSVSIMLRRNALGRSFVQTERMRLAGSEAREADAVAGLAVTRLSNATAIAMGISHNARTLRQQLSGEVGRAFLVAQDPMSRAGFHSVGTTSLAARHQIGRSAITIAGESGRMFGPLVRQGDERARYRMSSLTLDRRAGPARLSLALTRLGESDTVLGARFARQLSSQGAATTFVDTAIDLSSAGWGASASYRRGRTSVGAGGLARGGSLATSAWSLDLSRTGLFGSSDTLGFRVMQPLRVSRGGFGLDLPASYDYATGGGVHQRSLLNLAPTGRERAWEVAYGTGFGGGSLDLNAFLRTDPGHIESSRRDIGAAMRFTIR